MKSLCCSSLIRSPTTASAGSAAAFLSWAGLVSGTVEMNGRMHDVLDTVQEDRPSSADVEEALDSQDVLAPAREQHRKPDGERDPVELIIEDEAVSSDSIVMRMWICGEVAGLASCSVCH